MIGSNYLATRKHSHTRSCRRSNAIDQVGRQTDDGERLRDVFFADEYMSAVERARSSAQPGAAVHQTVLKLPNGWGIRLERGGDAGRLHDLPDRSRRLRRGPRV